MLYSDNNGEHAPSIISELQIRKALNIFHLYDKIGENKIKKMKTKFAVTLFALSKEDVDHVANEVLKRDSYYEYVAEIIELESKKKQKNVAEKSKHDKHDTEEPKGDTEKSKNDTEDYYLEVKVEKYD